MTKYLDQNGLAYFWTKIKAWLSSHAPVKYFGQNWVEDTNDDYALVVGDGVDENNPENVLAILNNGTIATFANDMDEAVTPSISKFYSGISNYDSQGKERSMLHFLDGDTSVQGFEIKTVRDVNGTTINNGLILGIDSAGNHTVHLDAKQAWQNELQPYSELFSVYDPNVDLTKANNNIPESDHWPAVVITDQNGKVGARFESFIQTNGKAGFAIYGKNYDTSGTDLGEIGFRGTFDKSGNPIWRVDFPAEFRNSIGASSGIWPISLGGSGMSDALYTATPADVITPASGVTFTSVSCSKWGKVACIRIEWKRNTAFSVGANGDIGDFTIGTLKEGWRPNQWIMSVSGQNHDKAIGYYAITSEGHVKITGFGSNNGAYTLAANTNMQMSACYICS